MKLYSPTVNKFFSFFFYDGESRTQAVEFRFSIFARCWEKIGYREDATDKFARSFIRAYPNRIQIVCFRHVVTIDERGIAFAALLAETSRS